MHRPYVLARSKDAAAHITKECGMSLTTRLYTWGDKHRGTHLQRFVIGMALFGMPVLIPIIGTSVGLICFEESGEALAMTALSILIGIVWFFFFNASFGKFMDKNPLPGSYHDAFTAPDDS
jgi:hypothetical protein